MICFIKYRLNADLITSTEDELEDSDRSENNSDAVDDNTLFRDSELQTALETIIFRTIIGLESSSQCPLR